MSEKENGQLLYDGFVKVTNVVHDGKNYDKINIKNAVAAMVISEDGLVLMVKQFRPSIGKESIEIVAGIMDDDTLSEEQTIRKELYEEAGIEKDDIINLSEITKYYISVGTSDNTMTIFFVLVKNSAKFRKFKDDDVYEKVWLTESDLNDMEDKVKDAKTLLALSVLAARI